MTDHDQAVDKFLQDVFALHRPAADETADLLSRIHERHASRASSSRNEHDEDLLADDVSGFASDDRSPVRRVGLVTAPVLEPTSGFDVVHPDTRFPVVESTPLDPLPSQLFRPARRRIDELPKLAGGSVFVFHTNGKFALAPEGPKMLSSDVVVKATMVAVVLTRAHEVPVFATWSATNSGSRLVLRASYNCRVQDPVRVLENGCWDVRVDLRGYLLKDAKLRMLGAREDAGRNPEVAQRILARMSARNQLEPPVIPGMAVQLIDLALNVQHDNGWLPGSRVFAEDGGEYESSGRDGFAVGESAPQRGPSQST